ncbi:uncharacterized protein FIBRA_00671 [Fibroporia radiculosa]|uniref:U3 small nucleolar RNA-associated protein 25 n=1 Tax=Fibroporia radiculosa TaxID=599839 RepID=J4H0G1_9APHY|nr:uncharacterized protein FIBRA_00671 [Fibroporia radiculosa]CCL98669.1 predicted protein [Fibroporia radiculosa]
MAIEDANSVTTRLLTLLNVSATKKKKRKASFEKLESRPGGRLNKRHAVPSTDTEQPAEVQISDEPAAAEGTNDDRDDTAAEQDDNVEDGDIQDPYEQHFGAKSVLVTEKSKHAADQRAWTTSRERHGRLGNLVLSIPEDSTPLAPIVDTKRVLISDKLKQPFSERQAKLPREIMELQNDMLSLLLSQRDVYFTRTPLDVHQNLREIITLHALNHITKKRRRILKNNERLTHASKAGNPAPEDVQDQGFTRPSVLILLPFRSFGIKWVSALTSHTPSPSYQVENRARFYTEYGLPPGALDKLANEEPGTHPRDHVDMFSGNADDAFRLGVKITRKSVKLFADFYGCDLIMASPLGLRMSIEKEKSSDFLSSIEVLVVDQVDALTMQNWEHLQYIFDRLNRLPIESHDVDFSRIKPWYLDGNSAYLRQSILLSAYETPEIRALFNASLKNVAGKLRTERRWSPVQVPEGIDQNFIQFDCASPTAEADKRFDYFTTQLLPAILKSAVQSANTVIFIPSSFDFIRVQNYFRKNIGVSFAVLSEYSSNQDISRARQAFFSGKKAFLLVSERFHFFRRYKIRGIRNLIFYGPPDHPQFYTEFLSYPFLDDEVEASDVTCRVLYSKYDWLRMERIAGTDAAAELIKRS